MGGNCSGEAGLRGGIGMADWLVLTGAEMQVYCNDKYDEFKLPDLTAGISQMKGLDRPNCKTIYKRLSIWMALSVFLLQ